MILMRIIVVLLALWLSAPGICLAQKQGNVWLLGDQCRVDFNSNPPTAGTGFITVGGPLVQSKASICDTAGRLLFFTDAVAIYNSRGNFMVNGQNIKGHLSSQQSSIILPLPGSDSIYYVFTSDAAENYIAPQHPAGYNYSIVDMSLDRKSIDTTLGAVIPGWKNIHLVDSGTEKLCAASDGINGYWILGHRMFSDSFVAWHLNSAGISPMVVTRIGPVLGSVDARGSIYGIIGQMKFSPDGKKVATVNYRNSDSTSTLDIFDFNPLTGQLSNHCQTVLRSHSYKGDIYGLEFWPDGSKLFITSNAMGSRYMYVLQFTLGGSCTAIGGSIDTIAERDRYVAILQGMQAGPDGNVYVGAKYIFTQEIKLDRITKPDGPGGTIRYDTSVFSWSNQSVGYTADLPAFVAGFRYHLPYVSVPAAGASAIKIQVSPNPVNQTLRLTATGTSGRLHATICDATGRQLTRCVLPAELDMGTRPAGMYFYRVYSDRGMVAAGKFWVRH